MQEVKLFTSQEAAAYINARLPKSRRWSDPVNALAYHRIKGNINPVPVAGDEDKERKTVVYDKQELDRFLVDIRPPGNPNAVDLSEYEDLIGKEPDTVVARLAGCSSRTVKRYRDRHQIAAWQPPEPEQNGAG